MWFSLFKPFYTEKINILIDKIKFCLKIFKPIRFTFFGWFLIIFINLITSYWVYKFYIIHFEFAALLCPECHNKYGGPSLAEPQIILQIIAIFTFEWCIQCVISKIYISKYQWFFFCISRSGSTQEDCTRLYIPKCTHLNTPVVAFGINYFGGDILIAITLIMWHCDKHDINDCVDWNDWNYINAWNIQFSSSEKLLKYKY